MNDLAITIPTYTYIKNNGIEKALQFYKHNIELLKYNFSSLKLQIILSNNTTENLHELEDNVVKVLDNNVNLYAFNARRKAFKYSDAKYIWMLDDDADVISNNFMGEQLANILKNKDYDCINNNDDGFSSLGVYIFKTSLIKELYNKIDRDIKISFYGEDTLLIKLFRKTYENFKEYKFDLESLYSTYSVMYAKPEEYFINRENLINSANAFEKYLGIDKHTILMWYMCFNFSYDDFIYFFSNGFVNQETIQGDIWYYNSLHTEKYKINLEALQKLIKNKYITTHL